MKRPQFAIGFASAVHALARRALAARERLAEHGVEGESSFDIPDRASGTAPTEPAMPIWRGTISRTGERR